jgi:hypothetical protein
LVAVGRLGPQRDAGRLRHLRRRTRLYAFRSAFRSDPFICILSLDKLGINTMPRLIEPAMLYFATKPVALFSDLSGICHPVCCLR